MNKFTGWVDVPLSEKGVREAMRIAQRVHRLRLDVAFTSHLERAHETLLVILSNQHCTGIFLHDHEHNGLEYPYKPDRNEIPVYTSWLMNERNYGALQGMNKAKAARKYGKEKVLEWRRSFDARPPRGESLKDVYARVVPYFRSKVWPAIRAKKNVLVVAHGNTLRAIIKYLENIPADRIANLELKPGQPHIYQYKGGKLERKFEGYSFTRPVAWK